MPRNQHAVPNKNGGWDVKGEQSSRAYRHTDLKSQAIDIARQVAQNQGTELFIHGKNGQFQNRDSHGHDPFPPRG